jgi:hypothetical protein
MAETVDGPNCADEMTELVDGPTCGWPNLWMAQPVDGPNCADEMTELVDGRNCGWPELCSGSQTVMAVQFTATRGRSFYDGRAITVLMVWLSSWVTVSSLALRNCVTN